MIFIGVRSLERAIRNHLAHYHRQRNHQGIGNEIVTPGPRLVGNDGGVPRREWLGGLLRYYYCKSA